MNQKTEVRKNFNSYMPPGGHPFQTVKRNVVFISSANSLRHEIAKLIVSYMIHKYGDVKWNKYISESLKYIESSMELLMKDFPKVKTDFLTEAVPTSNRDRRVDVVNLSTNDRFEIETSKLACKQDEDAYVTTIYI